LLGLALLLLVLLEAKFALCDVYSCWISEEDKARFQMPILSIEPLKKACPPLFFPKQRLALQQEFILPEKLLITCDVLMLY
jgi:hypothetical protein